MNEPTENNTIDLSTRLPTVVSLENSENATKHTAIDQLTLELLMNKRQYRKYIEKTNPEEYENKKEEYDRFVKYKPQIVHLINELLNDYSVSGISEHLGNLDIQDGFQSLLNSSVYFFETRDYDKSDTLFPPEHFPAHTEKPAFSAPFANHYRPGNSFWGKNISKQNGYSKFSDETTQ